MGRSVPAPTNQPSGRAWGTLTWTDNSGNLWLYGGEGFDVTGDFNELEDLWKYDISNNEWTWVNGIDLDATYVPDTFSYGILRQPSPNNSPGFREENNCTWVDDSDNLWLWGGEGGDYNYNDMWRYNIATNEWTWMSGGQGPFSLGSYGIKGFEDSSNLPPGRSAYARSKDTSGNFYIYGGMDFNTYNGYSDVWKYNLATNYWTWVAGDDTVAGTGNYGNLCVENSSIEPTSRFENRTAQVIGASNYLITFGGGYSILNSADYGTLSDLWLYDSQQDQWKLLDWTRSAHCIPR